ncbi:MAG: hypothetical protein ACT4NL_09510 [Pseudomarimonas sp.]
MTHSRTLAALLSAAGVAMFAVLLYDVSMAAAVVAKASPVSEASIALLMLASATGCLLAAVTLLRRNKVAPISA